MELLPLIAVLVVGAASIWFLVSRQQSQYASHVSQLQPAKEKRTKPKPEFRVYTREEVALHNKVDDAWIIIRNKRDQQLKVYDVTEYVDEHPGGESILTHVGGDATEGFHGPQHPDAVFVMVEEFLIGKVEE